ncbi:MAG: hypothetical protein JXR83_18670 [Deltaproteobacteria bacterium]|nr:hypothetical protein [Deltaproteobacteria bacterium]
MDTAEEEIELRESACAQAAARFFLGAEDRFDLERALPGSLPPELALVSEPLQRATRALAGLAVAGNDRALPLESALAELWRTVDRERWQAIAAAIADARRVALAPLDEAYRSLRDDQAARAQSAVSAISSGQVRDLVAATRRDRQRQHRLVRSRQEIAPLPIEAWRASLRPLIQSLAEERGCSIGVVSHGVGHAPVAFCSRHPRRADRLTLFVRADPALSTARSVAVALGRGLGGRDRTLGGLLGGALVGRLCSAGLWRGAGLGRGAARDAARAGCASTVRLLGRLWAYSEADDDSAGALAAAAAEILDERDDVASALCWRGPFPDPLGLPLPAGRPRLSELLAQLERGLALDAALAEAMGDDWHTAPEAAAALLTLAAAPAPSPEVIAASCLALGER